MKVQVFLGTDQEKSQLAFQVRDLVFTQEQGYPSEIDIDEYDVNAWHVIITEDDYPLATARLIEVHGKYKIGRVAVVKEARKRGLGLQVMQALIEKAQMLGIDKIVLHSQTHAQGFYEHLGFEAIGDVFLEDGQPHIAMVCQLNEKVSQ
ncbi:MAG: GNAT family N-acetyltransferase [Culicoidibacterales bacterium]